MGPSRKLHPRIGFSHILRKEIETCLQHQHFCFFHPVLKLFVTHWCTSQVRRNIGGWVVVAPPPRFYRATRNKIVNFLSLLKIKKYDDDWWFMMMIYEITDDDLWNFKRSWKTCACSNKFRQMFDKTMIGNTTFSIFATRSDRFYNQMPWNLFSKWSKTCFWGPKFPGDKSTSKHPPPP